MIDVSAVANRTATLRRCSVFSALPAPTLEFLAQIVRVQRFAAGETICLEGERANEVFVVEQGELSAHHAEEPLATIRDGELFGEFGMFGRGVRHSTVVSQTESVLLSLDYERFRKFLLQFPESTLALLEVAVSRFVDLSAV